MKRKKLHQGSQHSEELAEVADSPGKAARRHKQKVHFQELGRSTSEAAITRRSNRVTGVRRSNRRRGAATEEEGYVEWEGGAKRDESPTPGGCDQDADYAPAHLLNGILKRGAHEPRAILTALRLFPANWHHHKLIVHTDSTVVYHALNNQYSRASAQFMTLTKDVLLIAASRDIIIIPQWLSVTRHRQVCPAPR